MSKIKLMLDAVDILMNNYQIVSLRAQANASTQSAKPSTSNESAASGTTENVAAERPSSSGMKAKLSENSTDLTNLQAASSVASEYSTTDNLLASSSTNQDKFLSVNPSSSKIMKNSESLENNSSSQHSEKIQEVTAQIDELRKRRIKFLEEQTRSTNSTTD